MKKICITTFAILLLSFTTGIAQQVTPWAYNEDCNSLINTGIAAMTCGVTQTVTPGSQYTFGFVNMNGALPAVGRIDVSGSQDMYHHPNYDVNQIGNVYGLTMDDCGYTYICASANYGSAFFGQQAVIRYGDIGGGTDDLNAAGTIYIIDKETGAPSVWSVLPQQLSNFNNVPCEGGSDVNRNTGPGLGNICFHKSSRNFYVSNFEDGRIYRLDETGQILDSYDPLNYDSGANGVDVLDDLSYGLAVSPDGSQLFFGTVGVIYGGNLATLYSIDLNIDGSFVGSVDNTWLPAGATWDNYVGTELFHYTVDPGYAFQDTYFLSDLEFTPDNKLLLGIRMGCNSTIASSYNHYGKTEVLSMAGGLYNSLDGEIVTSGPYSLAGNDAYGGVGVFNNPIGGIEYVISSGDMLSENGPHGICTVPEGVFGAFNDPASPSGIISYGETDMNDPKGIGGDVQVFIECFCEIEECLVPEDTLEANYMSDLIGDCILDSIQFINGTTSADSVAWDFGDGSAISNENSPIHNYTMPGNYTVTLYVTDDSGCYAPDTAQFEVMIGSLPEITAGFNYNVSVDCESLSIFTSNTSELADTYTWDFGDGSPLLMDESPSYVYDQLGDITITLIASDSQGCAEPDTITINDTFDFTGEIIPVSFNTIENNECETLTADFTNTSTLGDTYAWDFGDGSSISNEENPTHIYTSPGTYTVTLTVSDSVNCDETNTETYIIDYSGPVDADLNIPALESCLDAPVQFSTDAVAPFYEWNFGDGSEYSNEQNPQHQYNAEGVYNVNLTVIDSSTCNISSMANAEVTITTAADANFLLTDTSMMLNEIFTVNYGNTNNVSSYIWDFGDGTPLIENQNEVNHFYNQNGEYEICLAIETEAGCTNEYCQSVLIEIESAIGVPNAFSPNSDSANDILFVKGYNIEWFNFKLFNRWGELVFETEDLAIGWDGIYNGKDQEMDVFAYLLNARLLDGTNINNQTGNVTLLR